MMGQSATSFRPLLCCAVVLCAASSAFAQPAAGTPAVQPVAPATAGQLAPDTTAEAATAQPPAADAPAPFAPAPPPAAADKQLGPRADPKDADAPTANSDPDDDDDDDGSPRADAKREDVMGVSPQASSFDGDAWGDDDSQLRAGPLTFRLALQTRYRETWASASRSTMPTVALRENVLAEDGDGFELGRFLLRMAVTPKPWLSFKGTLDFAKLRDNVENVVKQAIATLRPIPKRIEVSAGIFKIPYSILELDPVAQYELTDFGDSNELINDMGFAGRDVGVAVMLAPLPKPKWGRVVLSAFHGHAKDEHSSPVGVMAARVESKPWIKGLRFGASIVGMPSSQNYKQPFETSSKDVLPDPPDPLYPRAKRWDSGKAYGADISYSRQRFTVRVEGLLGDRVDIDNRYGARSYSAIWGLVAYRFKVGKIGLMPAARIEFMDADNEHDTGGRRLLSFGLNVLYKQSVRFILDVARTDVQDNSAVLDQPKPLPYNPYMALDNTRVTGQLQLEL